MGAIVILILGAGTISTYYNRPPIATTLPDSPYLISWGEEAQTLTAAGPISRPAEVKLSLLNVYMGSIPLIETMTAPAIVLDLGVLISTPSSTEKICAWKLSVNIRRVADENGPLVPPQDSYFAPGKDTELCIESHKSLLIQQEIIFPVPQSETGFLFTTGGPSNIFFTVDVSATGTIRALRAPQEIPG